MAARRRSSRKKKRSGAGRLGLGIFVFLVLAAAGLGWVVFAPYGPTAETFVELAPGSTSTQMGRQLEAAGVVRSQYGFDLLRLWKRGRLKAGEYRFDHPVTALEVYERIARGDVFTKTLVIPEGANIFDIAARVEEQGFGTRQEFLDAAASRTALIADLDPEAKSLEGYLFPDTYRFARKTKPEQICAVMVRRFRVVAEQLGLTENLHQVVTIASLVERETAVDRERSMVASVLMNRLSKKMPLMTDPAVIYGLELEGQWKGVLGKNGLTRDTPYNTYKHGGLTPGPISNPGASSLRAAMKPARTDYLYFVAAGADAQGGSLFSSTLEEHDRQVGIYRKAMKRAGER